METAVHELQKSLKAGGWPASRATGVRRQRDSEAKHAGLALSCVTDLGALAMGCPQESAAVTWVMRAGDQQVRAHKQAGGRSGLAGLHLKGMLGMVICSGWMDSSPPRVLKAPNVTPGHTEWNTCCTSHVTPIVSRCTPYTDRRCDWL